MVDRIKSKLLEAVGDLYSDDLTKEALIEILTSRIARQYDEIKRLEGANAHERLMMDSERRRMKHEMHRMRTDPLYLASGEYFFQGSHVTDLIRMEASRGQIRLVRPIGCADHVMKQISGEEYWATRNGIHK